MGTTTSRVGASTVGGDLSAYGSYKWDGAVWAGGCIFGMPCNAPQVLKVDPSQGTAAPVGPDLSAHGHWKWYGGVMGDDDCIYGIPRGASHVLRFDWKEETASLIGPDLSEHGDSKWWGGVLAADGWIYCVPCSADRVLRIHCASQAVECFGPPLHELPGWAEEQHGDRKWNGGVLAADGAIYCVPSSAARVLVIVPSAGARVHNPTTHGTAAPRQLQLEPSA